MVARGLGCGFVILVPNELQFSINNSDEYTEEELREELSKAEEKLVKVLEGLLNLLEGAVPEAETASIEETFDTMQSIRAFEIAELKITKEILCIKKLIVRKINQQKKEQEQQNGKQV